MGAHGYLDENAVEDAIDRGAAAARDLPNAEKLSGLLFEQARKSMVDVQALDDDDYVEDYLMIDRVELGALWFDGEIGPVLVPKAASDIAQQGWSIKHRARPNEQDLARGRGRQRLPMKTATCSFTQRPRWSSPRPSPQ